MATGYLNRTMGTPTDATKQTMSVWIKLSANDDYGGIVTSQFNSTTGGAGHWTGNNESWFSLWTTNDGGTTNAETQLSALGRDFNGWVHIVSTQDATQSGNDKMKFWINGVQQTAFSSDQRSNFSSHANWFANGKDLQVGRKFNGSLYFNGSMAHLHLCDGYAYSATDFGETDSTTGIWKPKEGVSVNYGNEGFFLKFNNASSMGTDSSGNGNNFTVNNSITKTQDCPDNLFTTLNKLNYSPNTTVFSNGNTTVTTTGDDADNSYACTTLGASKGKWYWEGKQTANVNYSFIGVDTMPNMAESIRTDANPGNTGVGYRGDGQKRVQGTNSSFGNTYGQNDIIQVALDLDNNFVYFGKNGTWQNSGDPTSGSSGTGGIAITGISGYDTEYLGCIVGDNSSGEGSATWNMNFGNGYFGTTEISSPQNDGNGFGLFTYTPPTGYLSFCTKNINSQGYS
jgi:hypothetical protein